MLDKLKNEHRVKQLKKQKRELLFKTVKKWSLRVFVIAFIASSLVFPVETGEIIGNWINEFFVTMYHAIIR